MKIKYHPPSWRVEGKIPFWVWERCPWWVSGPDERPPLIMHSFPYTLPPANLDYPPVSSSAWHNDRASHESNGFTPLPLGRGGSCPAVGLLVEGMQHSLAPSLSTHIDWTSNNCATWCKLPRPVIYVGFVIRCRLRRHLLDIHITTLHHRT